jgi:hypothetical protein
MSAQAIVCVESGPLSLERIERMFVYNAADFKGNGLKPAMLPAMGDFLPHSGNNSPRQSLRSGSGSAKARKADRDT